MNWIKKKPDYACVFVTRVETNNQYVDKYVYDLWRLLWEEGDCNCESESNHRHYYLSWQTENYDEWDSWGDCDYEEYLILERLPTMFQVHKQWQERETKVNNLLGGKK